MVTTTEEIARVRAVAEALEDERLKNHILQALAAFTVESTASEPQGAAQGGTDAVVDALRAGQVTTKVPRDALFLAVHAILLESGFKVQDATTGDALSLPTSWDAHSDTGLFVGKYNHEHEPTKIFTLQGLFVGNKFEVYLSDSTNTHSIELSVDSYIALNASSGAAADVLRELAALRQKLTPFLKNIAPKPKPATASDSGLRVERPTRSLRDDRSDFPSPYVIPPVGSGDLFPPGMGGGDPSTHVGPDHPIFGRRVDPSRGPIPGARFDPYGPFSTDPQGPPRGFMGGPHPMRPGPAPGFPFGEPNPDHMRVPGDDDLMDPFGPRRGGFPGRGQGGGFPGRGQGGGFGSDFPPHGSDHSFY